MNNSYSITKTCAERFAWMFNREHGTRISVVRALNAYGPGQKSEPVRKIMPNFILPALRGEAIIVYGAGSQVMEIGTATVSCGVAMQNRRRRSNQVVGPFPVVPRLLPGDVFHPDDYMLVNLRT